MKKSNLSVIIKPAFALFIICLVSTVLLAFTNQATSDKIEQNAIDTENQSRMLVLTAAKSFSQATPLDGSITYCAGLDSGGKTIGYIFTSSAKGYGGEVKVMTGFDMDGKIVGFEILDCSGETPGLGQNSKKDEFKNRFIGKTGALQVNKTSNDGQNIQAITAATMTSKAVVSAVNAASEAFTKVTGGKTNG